MNAETISFRIINSLSQLNILRQNLEEIGNDIALDKKCVFEINLIMEEIITNIITHGYTDRDEHWIDIDLWEENSMLVIRIEDDGIPFDPIVSEKPDLKCPLEERKVGGLGVHLVKQMACDVAYERCGEKNVLILKKTLTRITKPKEKDEGRTC
jgi:anti-sigma regulatory factor (Ser/Thr protein kinase)